MSIVLREIGSRHAVLYCKVIKDKSTTIHCSSSSAELKAAAAVEEAAAAQEAE